MDAFASIALATKPTGIYNSSTSTTIAPVNEYQLKRPSKRARSEKLPSPDWSRRRVSDDTRPATSYEPSPEERRREAELLLYFTQEAVKLTTPSPVLPKASLSHVRSPTETSVQALHPPAEYGSLEQHPQQGGVGDTEKRRTSGQSEVLFPSREDLKNDYQPAASESDFCKSTATAPPVIVSGIHGPSDALESQEEVATASRPTENLEQQKPDPDQATIRPEQDISERLETAHNELKTESATPISITTIATQAQEEVVLDSQELSRAKFQTPADTVPALDDALQSMEDIVKEQHDDLSLNQVDSEGVSPEKVQEHPEEGIEENESRVMHGALGGDKVDAVKVASLSSPEEVVGTSLEVNASNDDKTDTGTPDSQQHPTMAAAVCAACNFARNSLGIDTDNNSTSWISCDACKSWFHFACAGFKNERDVRSVDKFRCKKCKPLHGATTYVRKSSRAHSAIDYASLHQGAIKTSDERPEHHYIKPIKNGTITFLPENFARMRPELVTAEYFEKGIGMKEPIVIPAHLNPQPSLSAAFGEREERPTGDALQPNSLCDDGGPEDWVSRHHELESVPDHGQDALDMVVPQGLNVRQVAELYGPEEKVEVIDVKSQNGENKKWNMRKWAEYYENPNDKVVRNVISLEVSQSKLGRLIRRPKIVRDLDLQDSVWPEDLLAKGEYPRVQFYCLMSVADCFTDFHIDFGGSSVFYHILKGKKTFLFIPPKEKNLKKYEEWCMSPAQNWTFLGDQTKECYRVDLSEGDTMLIPAGWIHAVWTPEDSLVIGGNFLTRMNFGMQLRVAQVEKATGVARKFRYPHFQKLHWYTAISYLEEDPLPINVKNLLHSGDSFNREKPAHLDFDAWGENSRAGSENYHARYYSQSELDGLPELVRYLLRTALIDIGNITDGISADTQNAVKKSIPRGHGHGEPLDVIKAFASWCAWKRGNEPIPHWAYPGAILENLSPDKLSALRAPRRHSARMQSQQENAVASAVSTGSASSRNLDTNRYSMSTAGGVKRTSSDLRAKGQLDGTASDTPKRHRISSGTGTGSHRKTACESCRKRRRACKHKDQVTMSTLTPAVSNSTVGSANMAPIPQLPLSTPNSSAIDAFNANNLSTLGERAPSTSNAILTQSPYVPQVYGNEPMYHPDDFASRLRNLPQDVVAAFPKAEVRIPTTLLQGLDNVSSNAMLARPRTKACGDCRKSKVSFAFPIHYDTELIYLRQRRCIHDDFGNEDPVKVRESAIPRPHARKSNILAKAASSGSSAKNPAGVKQAASHNTSNEYYDSVDNTSPTVEPMRRQAPVANMIAQPPAQPSSSESQVPTMPALPNAYLQATAELALPLLDPALFEDNMSSFRHERQVAAPIEPSVVQETKQVQYSTEEPSELVDDQWENAQNYAAPEAKMAPATFETMESYEQPVSSLVSPPASSLNDGDHSPTVANITWTPSRSSSRESSRQPKQMQQQRYTPESGPMRRASSSSYGDNNATQNAASHTATEPTAAVPISPAHRSSHARLSSEIFADEESLRLIKELQAQEYGLRRRAKV